MKYIIDNAVLVSLLLIVTVITGGLATYIAVEAYQAIQYPVCQEDQVLVGYGDFNNGHWDTYICGPAVDNCDN
ncbi:MAG: hypothetical protein MJA29_07690 [Candidatus Omnitrophica bacterium]|nr:hypothetical protein [Candidatus Omnitrophota bacterium]